MSEKHIAKRLIIYLVLTIALALLFTVSIWWTPALYGATAVALLLAALAATEMCRR